MPMNWQAIALHSLDDFTAEPPTIAAMYLKVLGKASVYTAIFVGLWAWFGFLLTIKNAVPKNRGTWALKCAMLVHHGFICSLAVVGLMQDPAVMGMYGCFGCTEYAKLMNRDAVPSLAAQALTPMTVGYLIGDLLLFPMWHLTQSSAVENTIMLVHHICSILVWPAAVYFDWVSRYVLILLSYEFSTFWLIILWMLQQLELKKSFFYKLVGLSFTASFLIIRWFGAVPQLVAMWNAPPWSVAVERAASPNGIHEFCWLFSASLVLPIMMNFFWGIKVIKGFFGVLFKPSKKGANGKKE